MPPPLGSGEAGPHVNSYFFVLWQRPWKIQWACPVNSSVFPSSFSLSHSPLKPPRSSPHSSLYMCACHIYTQIYTYINYETILFTEQEFSLLNPASSFPFSLALCFYFYHFSSRLLPCVLLLRCSVLLPLGWPLRKPWARLAALLTLTPRLNEPPESSPRSEHWHRETESVYVFMKF